MTATSASVTNDAVRLVLLDSGGANLGSVQAAFRRLGVAAPVSSDAGLIREATHVLLPGVGAAAAAMQRLRENGLIDLIPTLTQPILGICVGMQLLFEHSEEGDTVCLGLLRGAVRKLRSSPEIRVPHMGWNRLQLTQASAICQGLDQAFAYFVHSYAVDDAVSTLATSEHGQSFSAIVGDGRVFGAQFHPERSSKAGERLLRNFLSL